MDEEQAAAAVLQSMASVEEELYTRKLGSPGEPGKTFDELFDWNIDDHGVPYHKKGPETFYYLYTVFWSQTEAKGATGYQDPGWNRTSPAPSAAQLIDARGSHHMYSNHKLKVLVGHELRGISVVGLRHYLGVPVGRRGGFKKGSAEHARARCMQDD